MTQFHFAKDGTTYPLILRDYRTPYEDDYHELAISALHPEYLIGLPLLVEVPGEPWPESPKRTSTTTPACTLARTIRTHSGSPAGAARRRTGSRSFHRDTRSLTLAPPPVADNAGRLVESNIVLNLNPPSAISDTSWIKPGKTSWGLVVRQ